MPNFRYTVGTDTVVAGSNTAFITTSDSDGKLVSAQAIKPPKNITHPDEGYLVITHHNGKKQTLDSNFNFDDAQQESFSYSVIMGTATGWELYYPYMGDSSGFEYFKVDHKKQTLTCGS